MKYTQISLKTPTKQLNLKINLSGVYNVYNLLAAVTVAEVLKISKTNIKKGVQGFKPAFGRIEKVSAGKKEILLLLCKNPTGFNEVLRTIVRKEDLNMIIAINDLVADGRDVSWLWDVDFEVLKGKIKNLIVSGIRAEDMALRLKYTNFQFSIFNFQLEKDWQKAIKLGLQKTNIGETLYILPTYTAMLEIRKVLNKMGLIPKSWED